MARLNVSLPDELAARPKEADLNLSAVTQDAVRRSLAARSTDELLDTLRASDPATAVSHERALEALESARSDAPTRHG